MGLLNYFFLAVIFSCFFSCKTAETNEAFNSSINTIAAAHVKRDVFESVKKSNLEQLIVVIRVYDNENYLRNSKYLLQIATWKKNSFPIKEGDSIFDYCGVEAYFGDTGAVYKNRFDKKFKYVIKSDSKKAMNDGLKYGDPLSEISVYFNVKEEITYISPGYDKIYYELLKGQVQFSTEFIEKLKE